MVRSRISARLHPPPRGITPQTGIRLDYPPWAEMPLSFRWAWKRVVQEIRKAKSKVGFENKKRDSSMYGVGGIVLGS